MHICLFFLYKNPDGNWDCLPRKQNRYRNRPNLHRHISTPVCTCLFFLSSRLCMPSLWPCCQKGTHIRSDANSNQHLVFLLVNQESRSLFDFDAMIWHASTFRRISNVFCLLIWRWWINKCYSCTLSAFFVVRCCEFTESVLHTSFVIPSLQVIYAGRLTK